MREQIKETKNIAERGRYSQANKRISVNSNPALCAFGICVIQYSAGSKLQFEFGAHTTSLLQLGNASCGIRSFNEAPLSLQIYFCILCCVQHSVQFFYLFKYCRYTKNLTNMQLYVSVVHRGTPCSNQHCWLHQYTVDQCEGCKLE